jgi:hypothetical protein
MEFPQSTGQHRRSWTRFYRPFEKDIHISTRHACGSLEEKRPGLENVPGFPQAARMSTNNQQGMWNYKSIIRINLERISTFPQALLLLLDILIEYFLVERVKGVRYLNEKSDTFSIIGFHGSLQPAR